MWLNIIVAIWPHLGIMSGPDNDLGIEIGQKWSEIDSDTRELLKHSAQRKFDNRKYFASTTAPNTDHCFVFTNECQLDFEHHVFYVENQMSKGDFFIVTFSYNYRVLRVEDTFNHKG